MDITVGGLVTELKRQFDAAGLPQPQLDARTLVGHLLDISLTDLVLDPGRPVVAGDVERVRLAAERRCRHEPVHRIIGHRSFFGLDLALSQGTLEPRPDTETLVNAALPHARAIADKSGTCRIIDLGTGSGAICLALLAEVETATGLGTDISLQALQTAKDNAGRNGLAERFHTACGSWFEAVEGEFDLIVSNPPYIRSADIGKLDPEVRDFDPIAALDGGADGLEAYRAIAADAGKHLSAGGHILVETGFDQHEAVMDLFQGSGFVCTGRFKDLGGNDRVLSFAKKGKP
ncbi:peptide chain release factor N(5)-glutamine methyltransferase [Hoeflea sp. TYP-13]|uniref:peptide chain release factor N(5)-glutamine methyltransferase n=1 Tax=Hoeflea sp. TYP-13 TaxID=3230023 RepID=UPI0034C6CAF1